MALLIAFGGSARAVTEDRLSEEQMTVMVAPAMASVDAGDLPAGRAAFARLLDAAPGAGQRADLMTAFGVALAAHGLEHDDGQHASLTAAIGYLRAAVAEYRTAYGPDHPEVALALNSLADCELRLDPANPPADVETLLDEANRIRAARLGPRHPETLAGLADLAAIVGLPSRTQGQPARIDAAIARLREIMAADRDDAEREPIARAYFILAKVQISNGRAVDGEASTRAALAWARRLPASDVHACGAVVIYGLDLVNAYSEHGMPDKSRTLLEQLTGSAAPCSVAAGSV